jgi:hypothetical protein
MYCAPKAVVKQMILVCVSLEQQRSLRIFQSLVPTKYMPFANASNTIRDIPSIGIDYSQAYGYAQEHDICECDGDVLENGISPSCR